MGVEEFLKARLAEEEQAALTAAGDPPMHMIARVLREVEAKRRIVDLADEASGLDMQVDLERLVGSRDTSEEPYIGTEILRALALAYADHPDYEETWSA